MWAFNFFFGQEKPVKTDSEVHAAVAGYGNSGVFFLNFALQKLDWTILHVLNHANGK